MTIGPGPYLVSAVNGAQLCYFVPTAMDLTESSGNNSIVNQAERTATTCFIRGFSEKLRFQTSSGLPWFWRRITVRAKNNTFFNFSPSDTPTQTNGGNPSFIETSSGMQRVWFNQSVNAANQTITNVNGLLFRGAQGSDWSDVLTAPIDTTRVDLVSDKSMTIRSGNASGTVKDVSCWHPYNHNLVYDDDENGSSEVTRYNSVNDKRGNGDMIILDYFAPGTGGSASDLLQVTGSASLYWHEK